MDKEEVTLLVHDTILNFPKNINKPLVMFLNKSRFSRYLDLMAMKKHLNKTPCFVAQMKGGDVIYFCREIVNELTDGFSREKKKVFIEAVTLHELFHVWNRLDVRTRKGAEASEDVVYAELKTLYPKHYKILRQFAQKAA
tara:strand:+ start:986 stop:1405 length:420 start_codon:yes stop_codon:yes gene_type:complete